MPGVFDDNIVSRIQQANDIVDVVAEHVSLKKKGTEMVGLCPFHDDHRPSLYVNSAKQIYKCFACGAGGDVFKFTQMRENLSFPQAIERLASRAGIQLPTKTRNSKIPKRESGDPNELARVNSWAAKHFQFNLDDEQKGKSTRKYLNQRKINQKSIKKWQLGLSVSNNSLLKQAKAKNIPVELLLKAGLIVKKNGNTLADKFVNRLMFPISDVTGRIIGFGGRTLDEKGPKYLNSPTTVLFDKSNSLYGLENARHHIASSSEAIVVEGYTDCIMAHQFDCANVVATLGTSFTSGHARIIRRYAKKAILLFDNDTAGFEAANRALEVCLSQRIDIKFALLPQAKDPCDFLLTAGKESFQKLIDTATDVFAFKWDRLKESFDSDKTLAGRKTAIEKFLQTIAVSLHAGNLSAIERGLIVNRLSKIISIEAKEINAELAKRLRNLKRNTAYSLENQKVISTDLGKGLSATAQREILEVLLNEPKLFEFVKEKITAEDFDVPILSKIATVLFERLTTESETSLTAVLAKIESLEAGECIVKLARTGEQKGNYKIRLTGALEAIQRTRKQTKNSEIKTIKDQKQFLRQVYDAVEKQNPHNIGMV